MDFLGIDDNNGIVYEGSHYCGVQARTQPLLLPVSFTSTDDQFPEKTSGRFYPKLFREDSLDPVTRIRRGRIYTTHGGVQPAQWRFAESLAKGNETQSFSAFFYELDSLNSLSCSEGQKLPLVVIGAKPFFSFWKILYVERSAHDWPIITLRAYRSLGEIPELDSETIPTTIRQPLLVALEKVDASTSSSTAINVIDRCRDALAIIFGELSGDPTKDLASGISTYLKSQENSSGDLRTWSAGIVNRLHSRGKSSEQNRRNLSDVTEEDAQLALRCLGLVLREVGYAK